MAYENSYDAWYAEVCRSFEAHGTPGYRFGQHYFNSLPNRIADRIVATEYDPYYAQNVTAGVHARVAELWLDT